MHPRREDLEEALRLLTARCPRLKKLCYWAGTSSIALEELGHRDSYDLDFHTIRALMDVRPILAEIRLAFPDSFEVVQASDAFGSGFQGVLTLPGGTKITIEVLSNYETVLARDLVQSRLVPGMRRVTLARYLGDKIQCVAERAEARDLLDIRAVLRSHPELEPLARRLATELDPLILVERLLDWTDEAIERDLQLYPGSEPEDAREARDRLLEWVRS